MNDLKNNEESPDPVIMKMYTGMIARKPTDKEIRRLAISMWLNSHLIHKGFYPESVVIDFNIDVVTTSDHENYVKGWESLPFDEQERWLDEVKKQIIMLYAMLDNSKAYFAALPMYDQED